ncbi:MAG: dephospho-CoA kinase [Steroidobacteraceae bacterium]|jgi:dephospho-CoA kinase
MPRRLRIGLTGGIASGKSTVEQRFRELGIPVINADDSARAVVAPGEPGLAAVIAHFGRRLLTPEGELDRRALRSLIFADPNSRKELETLLHPLIRADMDRRVLESEGPYIVLSIPLLIEGGARDRVDRVLLVDADESLQLERLMSRDAVSSEEARATLAAQASRAARLQGADDVIENAGTVSELRQAVDRIHHRYLELAALPP